MTVTPVTKAPRQVLSSRTSKSALADWCNVPLSKPVEAAVCSSTIARPSSTQNILLERLRLSLALEDVRAHGAGQDLAELHSHEGARRVARHARVKHLLQRA